MRYFFLLVAIALLVPKIALADIRVDPRTTPDNARRLNELIAKCEGELQAFRKMMDAIRRSDRAVRVFPGRDQPGVFVDGFGTDEIDLSDLERYANPRKDAETGRWVFPPGADREAASLCENLAHVLYERFHANYVGGAYDPSHAAANDYESGIRREFGQTGSLIDCTGDGHSEDAISIYRNGKFIIERDTITVQPNGSRDVGPIRTREVNVICSGACAGPPRGEGCSRAATLARSAKRTSQTSAAAPLRAQAAGPNEGHDHERARPFARSLASERGTLRVRRFSRTRFRRCVPQCAARPREGHREAG